MAGNRHFINDDFMLETRQARKLYHDFAANLPIIDYHCHLPPAEIAADKRWQNITQIWLYGDHYKWRAMRSNGVAEEFVTGKASDRDKFQKWAETMPYLLRNPLYHWTQLELARYFGVNDLLSPATADKIWQTCNEKLNQPGFSARGLIRQSKVVLICTTDDPADSLEHHRAITAEKAFPVKILPTWRPDNALAVENLAAFNAWIDKLSAVSNMDIGSLAYLLDALRKRHDFFHKTGCRLSDYGLETAYAEDCTEAQASAVFSKARSGKAPCHDEVLLFKSYMMHELAAMDHASNWTVQLHFGPIRNNNTRMFKALGPNTGFDSIGDAPIARPLARFLDRLDQKGRLARTILYNINPRDNALLATMLGNFQDGSIPGKIQFGSAWWFLDQKDGMEQQIEALSQMGLLSRFVGMLTDSRSFLSYTRHEYFRRILCNILGNDMQNGLIPQDFTLVGNMVRDISYNNAASYFGIPLPPLSKGETE